MKRNLFSIVIVLVVVLLGLACSPQGTSAPEASATPNAVQGGAVEDQASLIDALRTGGAEVELGDTVEQAFFTVAGQILKVNGKDVQVFEYESPEKMEADAAQVASDGGSIGTSMVTWVEPPHFFKSGRVLVLYVGEDKAVIDLLKGALGEQFAGR
jgi:hypothetical protein